MVTGKVRFTPRVRALRQRPDAGELARALRGRRGLAVLDSAAGEPRRFSLVGFDPLPLAEDERAAGIAGVARAVRRLEPRGGDDVPGPFAGGFLGALAYDLGVAGERPLALAPEPWGFPLVAGGLYTDFAVRDERSGEVWLVLGEGPLDGRPRAELRERELLAEIASPAPAGSVRAGTPRRSVPPQEHRRRVQRARELIGRGDLYQANLAHRFTCPVQGEPLDLYLRMRALNPAPYMGFLAWEAAAGRREALISCSPELLLELDGRIARTRPIKGTRGRGPSPEEDARAAADLRSSEKDRAELAMIVDLERNDLGRVALPGRVWVEGFPTLRSYASVHHLTADVVGEVPGGAAAADVLAALFPGGSVTGAPKLRAMQVIAELEGEGRGFFCGSLGFLDTRGRCRFNVLIRTLLWRSSHGRGEVSFRVGGGITWSSDPWEEDRETLVKARGMVAALRPGLFSLSLPAPAAPVEDRTADGLEGRAFPVENLRARER